jgi:hypothetical protein
MTQIPVAEIAARREGDRVLLSSAVRLTLICGLVLYAVLRVLSISSDGAVTGGFTPDSSYLSIVAEQVRLGHGLVNPAHWLLVLNPPVIPMPYHNANPGYPLLMATLAGMLHLDVVRCGFLISAVSNALLALAVFEIVLHFAGSWRFAVLGSIVVASFPSNWTDSLLLGSDALSTSLAVAAIAVLILGRGSFAAVVTGVLLGAAWLTRSSVILTIPPILWWIFRTRPRAAALKAAGYVLAVFAAVISPWFIYQYRVWGDPFRSDAGIYLMQNYYAHLLHAGIDQFWRSLNAPPPLTTILKTHPIEFATFYLRNLPFLFYFMVAYVSGWNKILAFLYLLLTALGFLRWRAYCRTPEFEAGALLLVLTLAVLGIRAQSFEQRYLGPALVLWVLWMLLPLREHLRNLRVPRQAALAIAAVLCGGLIAYQDFFNFQSFTEPSPELLALRRDTRALASEVVHNGRVLIPRPYLYTWFTGKTALSPPYATKAKVLEFMNRYGANYLALPTATMDYYYPRASQQLAPELHQLREVGALTVFEAAP